jgi:hypothetical protein
MSTVGYEGISMKKGINQSNVFLTIAVVCTLLTVSILPVTLAADTKHIKSFDKGPSYKPVAPIKKITMVNFDEETYLDDYAYLAAVPTSVFNDGDKLFSHPLLFYQDEYRSDNEKELPINARKGIDYFMEDWMSYCNGQLDQMTLINVPKNNLDNSWKSKEYSIIDADNPYTIASEIALNDWSYSDNAIIAVIDEGFEVPDNIISNELEKILPACKIHKEPTFQVEQTNSLNPVYHEFSVGDEYRYVKAEAWWDGILIGGNIMIPTGDPDLQLYCRQDGEWMQAAAAAYWNVYSPAGHEYTQSYVYQSGSWRVGITDFPTEGDAPRRGILGGIFTIQGSLLGMLNSKVTYYVDVMMYPGIDIKLPDNPPFGCRGADFELTWNDPNVKLGFTIIGPGGEAIFSSLNESRTDSQEIHLDSLGECLPGENYSVCVFAMDDIKIPVEFKLEYTWHQGVSKAEADSLTSATEGAILASVLNAPLLYVSSSDIPDVSKEAIYKLGVENIHLVNLGSHLDSNIIEEMKGIVRVSENYIEPKQIYDAIRDVTDSNDVIFTTIDPWTYWYMEELEPGGEEEGALFIGPSAFIAAHHGAPVLIVDNHPRLSSAVVWHNEFWKRFASDRYDHTPSAAEMVLTGKRIYDFLELYGFDKEGKETIITVADQYDIGIPWDRIFPGVAYSGRFCGTPVDTAYWISRNVFYPAIIFENPALQGKVSLTNGSVSSREGFRGLLKKPLLNTLVIKRESNENTFEFPVLCSFVTHKYRFNERASKYYGSKYQCADGLTPGETTTMDSIDQGVNKKHYGEEGAYFPDISETEVVPFYLNKGGFDTVFSTELESVTSSLNHGVILWVHASHGTHGNGGKTLFWNPSTGFEKHKLAKPFAGAIKEKNPWRGYDWLLGCTEEPDTMSMDMQGFIPYTNHESLFIPATGMDWVLARKPVREFLNKVIPFFDPFEVDDLYDGLTGTIAYSKYPLVWKNASEIENHLENLHSVGFITSICQTSNTYLHLTLIRHGSVFQVQDPWPTSWYGAVWRQSIPRDIVLGNTVGEAYEKGISHVGTLYLPEEPQWWWDTMESVVYFGDPDLRMYVPDTTYSDGNNWEKEDTMPLRYDAELSVDGHMPFGAVGYPHEKEPVTLLHQYLWVILALVLIIILLITARLLGRKQKSGQ